MKFIIKRSSENTLHVTEGELNFIDIHAVKPTGDLKLW
jgi:hypothetical protein